MGFRLRLSQIPSQQVGFRDASSEAEIDGTSTTASQCTNNQYPRDNAVVAFHTCSNVRLDFFDQVTLCVVGFFAWKGCFGMLQLPCPVFQSKGCPGVSWQCRRVSPNSLILSGGLSRVPSTSNYQAEAGTNHLHGIQKLRLFVGFGPPEILHSPSATGQEGLPKAIPMS